MIGNLLGRNRRSTLGHESVA